MTMTETFYVSCRFVDASGAPKGRAYAYGASEPMAVGQVVYAGEKTLVVVDDAAPPYVGEGLKYVTATPPEDETGDDVTAISARPREEAPIVPIDIQFPDFDSIVVIEQLPVITQSLYKFGAEIDAVMHFVLSLEATDENIDVIRNVRTMLLAKFDDAESGRKAVKNAVMAPYDELNAVYKAQVGDKFGAMDKHLKEQIDAMRGKVADAKRAEAARWFSEYAESRHVGWIGGFDNHYKYTIKAADTAASLKRDAKAIIDKIVKSVEAIDGMDEGREDILVEFKANGYNLPNAIKTVRERKASVSAEKERMGQESARREAEAQAAAKVGAVIQKQEAFAPPKAVEQTKKQAAESEKSDDDVFPEFTFTIVGATRGKLRALHNFLIQGGYEIGKRNS